MPNDPNTTDLPTKLRNYDGFEGAHEDYSSAADLMEKAAHEIERLRHIVLDHRRLIGINPPNPSRDAALAKEPLSSLGCDHDRDQVKVHWRAIDGTLIDLWCSSSGEIYRTVRHPDGQFSHPLRCSVMDLTLKVSEP